MRRMIFYIVYVFIMYKFVLPPFIGDILRYKADILNFLGNYEMAKRYYNKAIKIDYYRSERTAYDLAEIYRKENDYITAIKYYMISIDLRNYGEVYNNIGNCYYLLKDYNQALKNWELSLELGLPDDSDEIILRKNVEILKKMLKEVK